MRRVGKTGDSLNAETPNDPTESIFQKLTGRKVPFLELLKVHPVEADKGRVTFEMVVEERHLRTHGILHGGVTATLLDTAMGFAAGTLAPAGHLVLTVQLNVNFIRPAWEAEKLTVTGDVWHSGRQTAVSGGEIRTADDLLVATGTGTFLYVPNPEGEFEKQEVIDSDRL